MNTQFQFELAQRKQMFARIAISGASGAGKTYTALSLAEGFSPDGSIAVIDSLHGQSRLYADRFSFRVLELDTHSPSIYAQAIQAAEAQGFDVIIIDSISSAWNGPGGALAIVDQEAKNFSGNSFGAWSKVTPLQQSMTEAILSAKCHILVTLQSKMDYILEKDANGKSKPMAVGMAPVQRDGFSYVMDIEIYMNASHAGEIVKTRYDELDGMLVEKPSKELASFIKDQLDVGEEQEPHWSDSFKTRRFFMTQLEKMEIPPETLFACYGANNWQDMRMVTKPEGGAKAVLQTVAEYYADNV